MANLDMDSMMRSLGETLLEDPVTGNMRVDLGGLAEFVSNRFAEPGFRKALDDFCQVIPSGPSPPTPPQKDLRKVVFSALPVQGNSLWVVTLRFAGFKDKDGKPVSSKKASSEQGGVRQAFELHSWIKSGPEMGEDVYRAMEEYIGPPTTKQVEEFIQRSMALPVPPLTPCLPKALFISSNLKQHVPALSPFLNSLPPPFDWKVAPAELESICNRIRYSERNWRFQRNLDFAKQSKDQGNKEYAAKNFRSALKCYEEAINYSDRAVVRLKAEDAAMINEAKGLKAICFANSSIARLLIGGDQEIENAVENAKLAIALDELYSKGYVRLSRAYEAQGKLANAEEVIIQGLRLPELQDNKGLVDHLISLQTGNKGLPTDVESFEKWYQEKAKRMRGVGGLWLKICNEHAKKMHSSATNE